MALISGLTTPAFGGSYSFVSFDVPGLGAGHGGKINNAGQIVGYGYNADGLGQAFLKNGNSYELMTPFGVNWNGVGGITDNGIIVGNYHNYSGYGYTYYNGNYNQISIAPGSFRDVNNSGLIVGSNGADRGFIMPVGITEWDQVQFLDLPGATRDVAFGINDAGWIVGYINDQDGSHGFIKKGTSLQLVDRPGFDWIHFYDINNNGKVVGRCGDSTFIYNGNTFEDIPQYPGGHNTVAFGINDFGQLAGIYSDIHGNAHGFVATPSAPIPGGLLLMGTGLFICIHMPRRT